MSTTYLDFPTSTPVAFEHKGATRFGRVLHASADLLTIHPVKPSALALSPDTWQPEDMAARTEIVPVNRVHKLDLK